MDTIWHTIDADKRNGPAGVAAPRDPAHRKVEIVDNTSLAHPTRTIFVDEQQCEEIAELTGIEYRMLSSAFAGEEKNLAREHVPSGRCPCFRRWIPST
jgi:hypothetical protein